MEMQMAHAAWRAAKTVVYTCPGGQTVEVRHRGAIGPSWDVDTIARVTALQNNLQIEFTLDGRAGKALASPPARTPPGFAKGAARAWAEINTLEAMQRE